MLSTNIFKRGLTINSGPSNEGASIITLAIMPMFWQGITPTTSAPSTTTSSIVQQDVPIDIFDFTFTKFLECDDRHQHL
jgi:hypothetical protein